MGQYLTPVTYEGVKWVLTYKDKKKPTVPLPGINKHRVSRASKSQRFTELKKASQQHANREVQQQQPPPAKRTLGSCLRRLTDNDLVRTLIAIWIEERGNTEKVVSHPYYKELYQKEIDSLGTFREATNAYFRVLAAEDHVRLKNAGHFA